MKVLRRVNWRLAFLLVLLLTWGARKVANETRPYLLSPGLRMYAYVTNAGDGTVTAVDLVALQSVATIPVGPGPSGVRAHPTRDEIWGVSTEGGFAWVIDAKSEKVAARIETGAQPYAVEFSPDGQRAFVAASGSGTVVAIDCDTKQVVTRARAGRRPWLTRITPDGRLLVVPNRDDGTVSILDSQTLNQLATIPVAPRPEQVVILPDSSKAFVSASAERASGNGAAAGESARKEPETNRVNANRVSAQLSVVDLKGFALLANLSLSANPDDLILKTDGGELYVPTPGAHSLTVVNTWTNEIANHIVVGNAPSRGVLSSGDTTLYLSDAMADHVTPIQVQFRKPQRPVAAGQRPGVCRLTPGEDLLLVVNEGSNNLAVIRAGTDRPDTRRLITLLPVGPQPRDLAVKVFQP